VSSSRWWLAGPVRDSTIVSTRRLTSADGFVVVDLDDATTAVGIIRSAPKVLVDGATWLARSQTYQFASFGRRVSGASGAVNAPVDDRPAAIAAAVGELTGDDWSSVVLDAGRGVDPADLEPLRARDPRPAEWAPARAANLVAGILAAAERASGGVSGRSVSVEPVEGIGDLLEAAFGAAGAILVTSGDEPDGALHADAEILVVGSKVGVIGDGNVDRVRATLIVPSGPMPVTAKALAALGRAGAVVLPDFLTTAGHLAGWPVDGSSTDPAVLVGEAVGSVLDHPKGPLLGACERAEAFLETWTTIPFGRPIA